MTRPSAGNPATRLVFTLILLLPALTGCAEPFIVLAGSALSGEVKDPPADWSEFTPVQVVQLETQPDDPYSINIWMAAIGNDIYVATSEDGTTWTDYIGANPDVRLRIGEILFELEANRVIHQEERSRVAAEYVKKYDLDGEENWVMNGQVYRLDRR